MSTEDQIKNLKARMSAATASRARAQVEHDNALKERDAALAGLKDFGVTTAPEASALLERLERELVEALENVEAALKEAEA